MQNLLHGTKTNKKTVSTDQNDEIKDYIYEISGIKLL